MNRNKMMAFLGSKGKEAEPVATPTVAAPSSEIPPKRGPGRPKQEVKAEIQTTTIRLNPDDHLAVRQLALRDGQKMNELVFVALKEYCAGRGIKLQGIEK